MQTTMEQHVGEHYPIGAQGVLVLKVTQMMQFQVETMGNETGMIRPLFKMMERGNMMLIDPIRRPINWMWQNGL